MKREQKQRTGHWLQKKLVHLSVRHCTEMPLKQFQLSWSGKPQQQQQQQSISFDSHKLCSVFCVLHRFCREINLVLPCPYTSWWLTAAVVILNLEPKFKTAVSSIRKLLWLWLVQLDRHSKLASLQLFSFMFSHRTIKFDFIKGVNFESAFAHTWFKYNERVFPSKS